MSGFFNRVNNSIQDSLYNLETHPQNLNNGFNNLLNNHQLNSFTHLKTNTNFQEREKYMEPLKTEKQLFDSTDQITAGKLFESLFGEENDHEVCVTGPKEVEKAKDFNDCYFTKEILANLKKMEYKMLTQIQKFVIPIVQTTKGDILASAPTGSGKTAAFLLPVVNYIQHIKLNNKLSTDILNSPIACIITPTRELCYQLYNNARMYANKTLVSVAYSHAELPMRENLAEIKIGCDIFVSTIGRVENLIKKNYDENLEKIVFLKELSNNNHRTLMFSATLDSTTQYKAINILKENNYCIRVGELNQAVITVKQKFVLVDKFDKQDYVIKKLKEISEKVNNSDNTFSFQSPKTIVFVEQKRQSDRIAMAFALAGFNAISINGDRTQRQRALAIKHFSRGYYQVLVATDLASRGMNFPSVDYIINYDLKDDDLTYIHRIGRAGRAGNSGYSISLFDIERDIYRILRSVRQPVPDFMLKLSKELSMHSYVFNQICG